MDILAKVVAKNVLWNALHVTRVQCALHVPTGFGVQRATNVTQTV